MTFVVPGKVQGKGRPRFTKRGTTYTPKTTKDYEELIKQCYIIKYGNNKIKKDIPLSLSVYAYFQPPKSLNKKTKLLMVLERILPMKKPDGDNILKAIADALNGVAYDDDKQIVDWSLKKRYTDKECLLITIEDIKTDEEIE
ncbi:MAG: RusA family crossover junction endodeoxyribonuclease [Oscillospiraceae bacterium]